MVPRDIELKWERELEVLRSQLGTWPRDLLLATQLLREVKDRDSNFLPFLKVRNGGAYMCIYKCDPL